MIFSLLFLDALRQQKQVDRLVRITRYVLLVRGCLGRDENTQNQLPYFVESCRPIRLLIHIVSLYISSPNCDCLVPIIMAMIHALRAHVKGENRMKTGRHGGQCKELAMGRILVTGRQ